jgi:uncharacterized protein (TIGR02145 family)
MNHRFTLLLLFAALLLPSCREDTQVLPPVIHATLNPSSGNTTQTFSFDLNRSESRTGRGNKLFTRWDWDGDGTWDTPFTKLLVYDHRYYVPGTWKPRLEMTNLDGATDTLSFTIRVVKGQSPPKAVLRVVPETGHIFTLFLLDASGTRDDEDSLSLLKFRWDFEGDGIWDTPFGDSVRIYHRYPDPDFYQPRFQVKDPSGLISGNSRQIAVSLEDPRISVSFRCIPDSVTNNTPVILDASASTDLDFPDSQLMYRWDWNNDRIWDTDWLADPQAEHVFVEEFFHFVRLQVRSSRGLTNEAVQKVRVYHNNLPPRASFSASSYVGNPNTEFRFDCWSTRDAESSPSELLYRWDFDGDGLWDTDYLTTVVTMHRYPTPGTYKTLVQILDPHGGQDTCSRMVYISSGTNQTGLYTDTNGYIYQTYGTVLIGNLWWFARNLATQDTAKYFREPVVNNWPAYFYYGDLYSAPVSTSCPPGWRVPTREDWDKLFSNYSEDRLYDALMPGGESDFGADLGGMGIGTYPPAATYQQLNQVGYYWSTSKPSDPTSTSVWIITFDKHAKKVLRGYNSPENKLYSIRCVKDM